MHLIPVKLLQFQAQLRLAHWQVPKGEPLHRALGDLYSTASDISDEIVEVIQGKYKTRIQIKNKGFEVGNFTDINLMSVCSDMCEFLCEGMWKDGLSKEKDDEIGNLVQDLKSAIYKFQYLYSLG